MAKKVRWARYPAVDPATPSRVTIGGVDLAVSAYSRHPAESFDAAKCLRNAAHQKFSAINDGVPPTIESVYADPEMDQAYPMKYAILEELRSPAIRPRTPAYQNISTVMSATLSPPRDQAAADRRQATRRDSGRAAVEGGPAMSGESESGAPLGAAEPRCAAKRSEVAS